MALFKKKDPCEELEAMLDQEYRLVVSGEFAQLQKFGERKGKFLASIDADASQPATLQRLKRKVVRNQRILDAARSGFKAALDGLKKVGTEQAPLLTYDTKGNRQTNLSGGLVLERKA